MHHSDFHLHSLIRIHEADIHAVVDDLPGGLVIHAADDLDQGGFSCPVFTQQRMHGTPAYLQAHILQRDHTGKLLADVSRFKDVIFHTFRSFLQF